MLYSIINELRSDNGKNHKIEVLTNHKDFLPLRLFLEMCYSPLIKFGIKQIPDYTVNPNPTLDFGDVLVKINKLITREATGNAAKQVLIEILENSDDQLGEIVKLMIGGSAKAGINVSIINKVFGANFIKEAPYMGAKSYSEKAVAKLLASGSCISQVKADGRYANTIITDTVYMESRQGLETVVNGAFDDLVDIRDLYGSDCVLNGEIVLSGVTRYESNGVVSSFCSINEKIRDNDGLIDTKIKKDIDKFNKEYNKFGITFDTAHTRLQYIVWDIISLDTYKSYGKVKSDKYVTRFNWLIDNISKNEKFSKIVKIVDYVLVENIKDAKMHFIEMRGKGEEGTILKSLDALWSDGKGVHQIKFKELIELDLIITGFNYGTKGTKNENVYSTINVESACGRLKTIAGGLKEDMMDEFTNNADKYIGSVCTIECCGITLARGADIHSTMHPRFHLIRSDKTSANTLEECLEIEAASTELSLQQLLTESL
jgi:ribosomal protein L18E